MVSPSPPQVPSFFVLFSWGEKRSHLSVQFITFCCGPQGFIPGVTLCLICSEWDTGSEGLSTLAWEIRDANSSTATLHAVCHLGKPLQYIPFITWLRWQRNTQNKDYSYTLTQWLEQHRCRVCPGTQICSKGTLLSSFIKHEEKSMNTAAQELPKADTCRY